MPTNLLHHGPQNRIQKTSRNMAARKGPRLYLEQGQGLEAFDAAVRDDKGPLPATFLLHDIWILGCTKPTSEVAAVAQTVVQVPVGTRNLKCSQIPCPLPTHVQPLGAG